MNKKSILTESDSEDDYVENNLDSEYFNKQIRGGSLAFDNNSGESTKCTLMLTFYDNIYRNRTLDLPEISAIPKQIIADHDEITKDEFIS